MTDRVEDPFRPTSSAVRRYRVTSKRLAVRWVRMFSVDEDKVSEALQELYNDRWRVVAMSSNNGVPQFTLTRDEETYREIDESQT